MRTHDTTRTVLLAEVQAAVSEACLVVIYGASDLGKRFELIQRADERLFRAKRAGRNKVVL